MRDRLRSLRRDDRGQSLVELALAIPLLLFVLFAIIDFGLAINTENSNTNIANIAGREAAVAGTSAKCGSNTETTLINWLTACGLPAGSTAPCSVQITDTGPGTSFTAGDAVQIQVLTDFHWLGLITNGVTSSLKVGGLNPTTQIPGTATFRMEQNSSVQFMTPMSSTC